MDSARNSVESAISPKPLENRSQSQPVIFEREGDEEGEGKLQLRLPLLRGPKAFKFMLICK